MNNKNLAWVNSITWNQGWKYKVQFLQSKSVLLSTGKYGAFDNFEGIVFIIVAFV